MGRILQFEESGAGFRAYGLGLRAQGLGFKDLIRLLHMVFARLVEGIMEKSLTFQDEHSRQHFL